MAIIDMRNQGGGFDDTLQRIFSEFNASRRQNKELAQQQSQSDRSYDLEKQRTGAEVSERGANQKGIEQKTEIEYANAIMKPIETRVMPLIERGMHKEAEAVLRGIAEQNKDNPLLHRLIAGLGTETPDTPFEQSQRNASQFAADATGRAAAGSQNPNDINQASKIGPAGAFIPSEGFADQLTREAGPAAHAAAVSVGAKLAPTADQKLVSETSRQNQESSNAAQIKVAGMNADSREATAEARGAASVQKPLSGESAKVLSVARSMQPEIEQFKKALTDDFDGTLRGVVFGTNREMSTLLDSISDKVGRLRSGGGQNKDEEAKFKRAVASWMDIPFGSRKDSIASLDRLMNEAQIVESTMSGGGNEDIVYNVAGERVR